MLDKNALSDLFKFGNHHQSLGLLMCDWYFFFLRQM